MQNVYTVAQVTSYIRNMFTQDFMLQRVRIRGEVSNCKYHTSGHIYFTLKDEKSTITCVMFASDRKGLSFRMAEGQQVVVAETGAAVRDIINVAKRRNPYVQIILYPAIVQGEAAVSSIIEGIRAMERLKVDLIIVGRGGGSIEDLWAFNEEPVAQAVFDCNIPIISAVGHETDVTITDFVADLRAPTPSAAAELAVCDFAQLEEKIAEYAYTMHHLCRRTVQGYRSRAQQYGVRLKYLSPLNTVRVKKTQAVSFEERLQAAMERKLEEARHRLALYAERMKGLSPLDKLSQGYAYAADASGKTLCSVEQVNTGERIRVYVKDGSLLAQVQEKLTENG